MYSGASPAAKPRPAGAAPGRRPAAPTPPRASRAASPLGGIALVLVVLEGAALAVLWTHPRWPDGLHERLAALQSAASAAGTKADQASAAVAGLGTRVDGLSKAGPVTSGPSVAALAATVEALKQRIDAAASAASATPAAGAPAPATQDLAPLQASIASLGGELASLKAEQGTVTASLAAAERADFASLRQEMTHANAETDAKVASLSAAVASAEASGQRVAAIAGRAERLARLQAAGGSIDEGRPIGVIEGVPPALARYAGTAPPTEAALVLGFPAAARAALRASQPDTRHAGFFRRLWVRSEGALTISDGNRVLVGDPAAGIVASARERLAAGDLRGGVHVLGALQGSAAAAMAPWLDQARDLLAARDALAAAEAQT